MTKAEWSGWVQAVGSIAAILVSATIVWWQVGKQHRLQLDTARRNELRDELTRLEGFHSVLSIAQGHFELARESMVDTAQAKAYRRVGARLAHFDLIGDALDAADASKVESASTGLSMRIARKAYHAALGAYDSADTPGGLDTASIRQQCVQEMAVPLSHIDGQLLALRARIDEIKAQL